MKGVERQSSIDNEPRTLSNTQIQLAREVALYVVNTRSNEEALTIFTEGLVPVALCGGGGGGCDDDELTSGDEHQEYDDRNIRDILTAPF